MMPKSICQEHRGFTLLELVLVLLMISLLMALAAPSLRGWSRGAKLRDAADQFLAATRFARSQAISSAMLHRIQVDPLSNTFTMTTDQAAVSGEFARAVTLPTGIRIDVVRLDGNVSGLIEFHPTGRTTPARVRFLSDTGDEIEVQALTAAETFQLVQTDDSP